MISNRLNILLSIVDERNELDPVKITLAATSSTPTTEVAKERLYAERMRIRLSLFAPNSSEELQIAAYCQHIQRWTIPRSDYPMDKVGYKRWRTDLGKFHANTAAELMAEQGYDETAMERVKYLLQKKGLKRDPETQTLEDVICLVFLEHYLDAFASKHTEEKVIDIIQKTWRKMSDAGHDAALALPLPSHLATLVGKALS